MTAMRFTRRALIAAALATGAVGCASNEAAAPMLQPIYFSGAPLSLSVSEVDIRIRPRPPQEGVRVIDDEFPAPLSDIARLWANQRLRAEGGDSRALLIVDDASAVSFGSGGAESVEARLRARLAIIGPDGEKTHEVGVDVTGSGLSRRQMSPMQRENFLHGIAHDMARRFDNRLSAAVLRDLGELAGR